LSKTAKSGDIVSNTNGVLRPLTATLDYDTFEYMDVTREEDFPENFVGRVSSYNINTYKGRIFIPKEGRPIPFELSDSARNSRVISLVTRSLADNAHTPAGAWCRHPLYRISKRQQIRPT
jgi:hypothetical protein